MLSDTKARAAKTRPKPYKLTDSNQLFLPEGTADCCRSTCRAWVVFWPRGPLYHLASSVLNNEAPSAPKTTIFFHRRYHARVPPNRRMGTNRYERPRPNRSAKCWISGG